MRSVDFEAGDGSVFEGDVRGQEKLGEIVGHVGMLSGAFKIS